MSTKFTNDEWMLFFQQRTQSGLSIRKWCDRNRISYDQYKYWEKKLLRETTTQSLISPIDFAELPQALRPSVPSGQESFYPFELSFRDFHLKISDHADLIQLAGILKLLPGLC